MNKSIEKAKYPLVSVIIPVYNVSSYLAGALDSVINQTYTNLEVIIVDDGSNDGSGEICENYAGDDPRIQLIHQSNKGLSAARNKGLDLATGAFIAFLDSDDVYDIAFVEKMMNVLLRTGSDLSVCNYRTVGEKKDQLLIKPGTYSRISALRALIDGKLNWSMWNKIYRRELWDGVRFPEGHVYEDVDTAYKLLDNCKYVVVLDETLYFHRDRPGSITNSRSPENIRDWIRGYSHFFAFVEGHSDIFTQEQLVKTHHMYLDTMMNNYIKYPKRDKYREKLRQKIIKTGKGMNVGRFGIRTRVAYVMVYYCPWLLRCLSRFLSKNITLRGAHIQKSYVNFLRN